MKRIHSTARAASAALAVLLLALAWGAASAQPSTVSFQGQLSVSGTPFTGTANFKFAILCGASSPWSNDGTSASGSEPTAAVALPVQAGIFSVLLGDPALSMVALTADLIESCSAPKLRIWVDTGGGFEQLSDQPLASSPFALQSDVAGRSIGSFLVQNGSVRVSNGSGTTTIALFGANGEVSLSSIRFADNSVQTTAAGAGGPDNDWIINGANMTSGVAGNVGIGVAVPAVKLHVVGDLRVDGANGVGIDARNPNATSAIARFGWLNDVARIRVGGNGVGALNGFDFEGINDVSWLRILNNGNVGIGMVTPSQRLEVAGNAVIQGDLTIQGGITVTGGSPTTRFLAIPPDAFQAGDNTMAFHRSSVLLNGTTAGGGMTFEAPVYLPHGSTITEFTIFVTDSDGTGASGSNIQTFLLREPLGVGAGAIIGNLNSAAGAGAPGFVTVTQTGLSHVVDNQNNSYVVTANWKTPVAPLAVTALQVNGMRITYTVTPSTP
jgi:hypothetical protein